MRQSLIEILMERDVLTEDEAQELIDEAREALQEYIENGDLDYAENVCEEYFNLEPDYLDELM